VTISCFSSSIS